MYVNPLLYPMLVLALLAFYAGGWLIKRIISPGGRFAVFAVAAVLAVPGLLFTLYYTHRFDDARWFYYMTALILSNRRF